MPPSPATDHVYGRNPLPKRAGDDWRGFGRSLQLCYTVAGQRKETSWLGSSGAVFGPIVWRPVIIVWRPDATAVSLNPFAPSPPPPPTLLTPFSARPSPLSPENDATTKERPEKGVRHGGLRAISACLPPQQTARGILVFDRIVSHRNGRA